VRREEEVGSRQWGSQQSAVGSRQWAVGSRQFVVAIGRLLFEVRRQCRIESIQFFGLTIHELGLKRVNKFH